MVFHELKVCYSVRPKVPKYTPALSAEAKKKRGEAEVCALAGFTQSLALLHPAEFAEVGYGCVYLSFRL